MNEIISDVEKLKEEILSSEEYLNYKKYEKILDSNEEINKIITKIKRLQQQIIKNQDKQKDTYEEEIELQSLYKQLDTYEEYRKYIDSSKKLNEVITYVQKSFEEYFNNFII